MQFVTYNKSRARQHRNSKFEKKKIRNKIRKWFVYILFHSKKEWILHGLSKVISVKK